MGNANIVAKLFRNDWSEFYQIFDMNTSPKVERAAILKTLMRFAKISCAARTSLYIKRARYGATGAPRIDRFTLPGKLTLQAFTAPAKSEIFDKSRKHAPRSRS